MTTAINQVAAPIGASEQSNVAAAARASASGPSLDYNAFLKLLIAQIQNQDPLEPMKSTEQVAQLATFSQVEQSMQMNERLGEILATSQIAQASSLIGQDIVSADGETRGTVSAVRIEDGGLKALLDTGLAIVIEPGVVIGGVST